MNTTPLERFLILFFRVAMGWTFLWAGTRQVFLDPNWSAAVFLSKTKTFHDVYEIFAAPAYSPFTSFAVKYGHLLIGLSLISGLMVRVSAAFGTLLMLIYWTAHMDFPYIENRNNLILDYHVVYAGILVYLIHKQAGHVWGLDAIADKLQFFRQHPRLRPLFA
jgi:thiosulfate dehydrogenase [quinone] large subunit